MDHRSGFFGWLRRRSSSLSVALFRLTTNQHATAILLVRLRHALRWVESTIAFRLVVKLLLAIANWHCFTDTRVGFVNLESYDGEGLDAHW